MNTDGETINHSPAGRILGTEHVGWSPSYNCAFPSDGPAVTHDEELLGELPTATARARIRRRDMELYLRWLRLAKPGLRTLYHIGELARDRVTDPTANLIAHLALRSSELGLVHLVQERVGIWERHYYAQRTAVPYTPATTASLHVVLDNPPPALVPIVPKRRIPHYDDLTPTPCG